MISLQGSTAHTELVPTNGIHLSCTSTGDGPPVLLLHGFPETHRSWDLLVPALVRAGYRTVALDLRGYGASDKPRTGYDLASLGRDVAGIIDALALAPVRVVGHDWGAAITWELLRACPEKILNATILNGPHPALMAKALQTNARQRRRSWYMFFFQLPLAPERWLSARSGANLKRLFRESTASGREPPAELVELETRALLAGGLHGPLAYYRTAFRGNIGVLLGRGRLPASPPVRCPVTVIWGEDDTCLGIELLEGLERYASRLQIQRVQGAGHFVHQERPDRVSELILSALSRTT